MFRIISDSCVDLPDVLAKELDIQILPLKVTIKGKEYSNFLDHREINPKQFYDLLRNKETATTAQANPQECIEIMEEVLKNGEDVLFIVFSSQLSGTYNSCLIAQKELAEKYPDRKIIILDSLSASMGQGLLVVKAAQLKQSGKSINEVADFVENTKKDICHLFTVSDLGHLKRGGRLSNASFILGKLINIKPLLHVSIDGKLKVYGKARGRFKSLNDLISRLEATYDKDRNDQIYISHGDSLQDALYVRDQIIKKIGLTKEDFLINEIGPVIGAHSGVDTIAIFYVGNERTE
ncbi:DegV family protein [Hujiaoplasma nucleasis]|uniref:DegV family protein n=1 Tax=Hujiaoplasma nucleasis TaxID=2725268 RepID=A0A7L6N3T6_9MOLU|nr:DegV family protein [Hujiaoplasma nucleasis]QLY40122.1 DegV family protein [Hujiaoplasma nucleasis]